MQKPHKLTETMAHVMLLHYFVVAKLATSSIRVKWSLIIILDGLDCKFLFYFLELSTIKAKAKYVEVSPGS